MENFENLSNQMYSMSRLIISDGNLNDCHFSWIDDYRHFSWIDADVKKIPNSVCKQILYLKPEQLMLLLISDVVHLAWNELEAKCVTKKEFVTHCIMSNDTFSSRNFIVDLLKFHKIEINDIPREIYYAPKINTIQENNHGLVYEGDVSYMFTSLEDATFYLMRQ